MNGHHIESISNYWLTLYKLPHWQRKKVTKSPPLCSSSRSSRPKGKFSSPLMPSSCSPAFIINTNQCWEQIKSLQSLMLKLFSIKQCFPFELYLDLCLYCITGEGAKEEISWVSNQRFNGTVWSVFGGCHGGQTEDQLFSLMISWSSVCLLCQSYDQRMDPRRKGNHPAWTKPGLLPDTDTESPAQHRQS